MTIDGATPLHQQLFDAIEARDLDALNLLLREHWSDIAEQFESWARVPAAIRNDQQAASRYVHSLVSIAQALEAAGQPSFLRRLMAPDDTNPIIRWQRRAAHAQALSEAGDYAESTALLNDLVGEMEGAIGTAVVNLRPRIFGTLGSNALHVDDYTLALDYTRRAYDASLAAGDGDGRNTYYENLMSLRAIALLEDEPERGERLLRIRRLVTRAQQSADAGRYLASRQALIEVLALLEVEPGHELFEAHAPKVHGLLGFIEHKLGNSIAAREQTAVALDKARALGDADGVRIYTANLNALEKRGDAGSV